MAVDDPDNVGEQDWYQLDNAAALFPSVVSARTTTLFRVSATLTHPVNASALQRALANIMPRFPYYLVFLKHGAFWHYLIRHPGTPRVSADAPFPCMDPPPGFRQTYLFRTRASGRRIAVEFSHILTDGTGALTFLRALLTEYAMQLGIAVPDSDDPFRKDQEPDPEEFEDAYARYFSSTAPNPEPDKAAFRLSSRLLPVGAYRTLMGTVPVTELVAAAKKRGVTITVLLAAVLAHSMYELYLSLPRSETRRKGNYLRVEVPVNLRKIFPTKTMRNFSLFVMPGIDLRLGPYSLDDTIELFHHYLRVEVEGRFINKQIARNIRGRRNPIVRVIPLVLKKLILPYVYFAKGESLVSTVLTNLGVVKMPEPVARLIERFEFVPAPSKWNKTGCAVASFGEHTCITFGRMIREAEVERRFFTSLVKLGIPVKMESQSRLGRATDKGYAMPYCSNCGVEVDEEVEHCPLCDTPIHRGQESDTIESLTQEERPSEPDQSEKPRMSGRARRKLTWEVTSVLCLIAVFVVAASDLRANATLGWALYPMAAVLWAWTVSTITIFVTGRPLLVVGGWAAATLALLAAINLLGGGLTWFVSLCLPIFALGLVVSVPFVVVATRLRIVGLNVVALASVGAAVACTGIDAVIEHSLTGTIQFSWSLIADEALLPFAAIMIFVHLRLRTKFNFRRIFHL